MLYFQLALNFGPDLSPFVQGRIASHPGPRIPTSSKDRLTCAVDDLTWRKILATFHEEGDDERATEQRVCARLGPACQLALGMGIAHKIGAEEADEFRLHNARQRRHILPEVVLIARAVSAHHEVDLPSIEPMISSAYMAGVRFGSELREMPKLRQPFFAEVGV